MDRSTAEGAVRALLIAGGLASLALSLLYLLSSFMPMYYFHGYVEGYYSPLDYRLHYSHNHKPIYMPHTDYVRHVTLAFASLSAALLATSLASLLSIKRRPPNVVGLSYGASAGLVVLHSLFNGYILKAVALDFERFTGLIGDAVTYRTLAGTVTFEGVRIEVGPLHALLTCVQLPLLIMAVAPSAVAAGLALYTSTGAASSTSSSTSSTAWIERAPGYLMLSLTLFVALASSFTYYPSSVTVAPGSPPATFEPPPYAYTCIGLPRSDRGALNYTDFESYPVPGWASLGGVWELSSGGGFKGNALRGRDNNWGVGRASSQYYWDTRIDGYSSLWASVKVRAERADRDGYKGIGLLSADRARLYEASVQSTATIRKYDGSWKLLGSASVPNYTAAQWYTLALYYSDLGTSIALTLFVYDADGRLVAQLSVTDSEATRFRPAYAGVTIDATPANWFRFEDFVVSRSGPAFLAINNAIIGMAVEVWDDLGNLVVSHIAGAPATTVPVIVDAVVGTGVDGRIVLKYPDSYVAGSLSVPIGDAIVGGDSYSLLLGSITVSIEANGTSSSVHATISSSSNFTTVARVLAVGALKPLYARLVLEGASLPPSLNLNIWIEGALRSTNITISNGAPVTTSTSTVPLALGRGNAVAISGYFTAAGQSATLSLKLELYTAVDSGVYVRYPLLLQIASP